MDSYHKKQEKLGFPPKKAGKISGSYSKKSKEKFGFLPKKKAGNIRMPTMLKVTTRLNTEQHLADFSTFPATGLTHHAAGAQHEVPPQKEPLPAIFSHEEGAQKAVFWRGQPVNPSDFL